LQNFSSEIGFAIAGILQFFSNSIFLHKNSSNYFLYFTPFTISIAHNMDARPWIVMKFGGTSVGLADRMRQVVRIIKYAIAIERLRR
jgi:hypothetical protein